MNSILIVEDDLALSSGLCFELDTDGYLTSAAYTLKKARQLLKEGRFQLVLLDVNLPDGSGFDFCREIKAGYPALPVIFLTANDMEQDVINGFDLGADDYITKPFHTQILKRRIEVALRRGWSFGSTRKSLLLGIWRSECWEKERKRRLFRWICWERWSAWTRAGATHMGGGG